METFLCLGSSLFYPHVTEFMRCRARHNNLYVIKKNTQKELILIFVILIIIFLRMGERVTLATETIVILSNLIRVRLFGSDSKLRSTFFYQLPFFC